MQILGALATNFDFMNDRWFETIAQEAIVNATSAASPGDGPLERRLSDLSSSGSLDGDPSVSTGWGVLDGDIVMARYWSCAWVM